MFDSQTILTSKSQLGVIWLAATLPRKKLSKKQINQINIIETCDLLTEGSEPMGLRLVSNLMMGVTRIYSSQTSLFYNNVNQVYLRVKNAYAAIQSEHLDMPTSMARLDTITFGEGDCDLQAEMTIDLARLKIKGQKNLGWNQELSDSFPSSLPTAPPTAQKPKPGSGGRDGPRSVQSRQTVRSITLPESPGMDIFGSQNGFMFQDQDDFLMDGNDSAAVSSSRAEGDPLDPFSLLENVAHSHMCRESSVPRDTFMLDDPLMHSQLVHEEDPIFHDPSNDADFFPTLSLVGTKVSVEELEQEKPQKKKVVRKKGLQVDSATSLSVEDIRAMQAGSTLQKIRLSADQRQDAAWILESLNYPIIDIPLGPSLKRFWDESVVEYRKKNQLPALPTKARRQGPTTTEGDFNEPFDDLFMPPPFEDPMDPMMPVEDGVMEPEVFRAAPDQSLRSFETPSQLPWHHSRAGSTNASRASKTSRRESISFDDPKFNQDLRHDALSPTGKEFEQNDIMFSDPDATQMMDAKVPLEKETFSFFAYVKDIMLDAETDHLMLSDVLPVESTSKSVAAQAFYHVLVLATRQVCGVTQDGNNGGIGIHLLSA